MRFSFVFLVVLFSNLSFSQSVTVGGNSFGGSNVYGPMYSTNLYDTVFSRQAYIYPSSVLSGLNHGDTINSLEFYAEADLAMTGNPNLKIYLRMVKKDTFSNANLNWTNESNASGSVLVYDANPISIMNGYSGFKNFILNKNKFKFDTTGGKLNLEILFAYDQITKQPSSTFWTYESNFTVSGFKSKNEGKISYGRGFAADTTKYSDIRKPFIRINFPRFKNNLSVLMTYGLGKVPLLAGVNDSVRVLIANLGKGDVSNTKIYLDIHGANTHRDSLILGKFNPWDEKYAVFGNYKPDSIGTDSLIISLAKDEFVNDNYDTLIRNINYNIFSHTDPFQGNAGGIGFNGSTGDFVAKFFSDTGVYINQVSVDFSSTGRGFRVGIWDDDGTGGLPGKVLFMSDSLLSKGGTYILPVLPRVKVNGGFYVGIRQNTNINVGFSFQYEDPIRPGAFFFTDPMGNTNWTPFSPGFPYKFNIQPRIQVANDVSPIEIIYPQALQDIQYSMKDSIGPRAIITNFGINNQSNPFDVECVIANAFGTTLYKSTKKISLNSGQSDTVTFDTTFRLYNLGANKITVTTKLGSDKIIDNDILVQTFKISIKHDIGVDFMYTPDEGAILEYKRDTVTPTVRIINYGTVPKNNFKVTFRIRNDTSVIYTHTQTQSLAALNQQIITFNKFIPLVTGDYIAECFTTYKDSIPFNDTIRHAIYIQKSNDVGPRIINIPLSSTIYTMGGFLNPRVTIKNYGQKTQDTAFKVKMKVFDPQGKLFFTDSAFTQLGGYSETQLNLKRVNIPMSFGKYKIEFRTELKGDQELANDTLSGFFTVIPNRDIGALQMILPFADTVIAVESIPFKPIIKIKNYGSQTINSAGPVVLKIYKNSKLIYYDSTLAGSALSYNSGLNVVLNKNFSNAELGLYTIKAYTSLSGDLIALNDTLTSNFRLTRYYDLAIDTFSNFSNGQVFTYENIPFTPQILIKNFGAKSYPEPYSVKIDLFKNQNLVKSISRQFDSLPLNATNSWFQDSLMNLNQIGDFKLRVSAIGKLDQNNLNDSFCWNFSIIKPNDLALDSIVLPDKNNYCYHFIKYQPRLKIINQGSSPINNTIIQFRVYQTSNVYWESSRIISLAPDESKWLTFDSTLTFNFIDTAWARAIGSLNNDNEKSNDTIRLSFNVDKESSVSLVHNKDLSIYPNPTFGNLMLSVPDNLIHTVVIWNPSGQKVYEKNAKPNLQHIELRLKDEINLKPGVYFIKLYNLTKSIDYKIFKVVLY